MNGLRVLFVVPQPSSENSAAIRRLFVLRNGLQNCGAQTRILYLGDYFPHMLQILQPINIPRFLKLLKCYGANTCSIVHAAGVAAYVMGVAKTLSNFTLICDVQGSSNEACILKRNNYDVSYYYRRLLDKIDEPIVLRQSDYFIACSQRLKRELILKGIRKDRICVIRNGVDTELFKPGSQELTKNAFTVTYAGCLQKYQGLENLLDAAKLLKNDKIKFKIIGLRNSDAALEERIRQELGSKVELVHFLPQKDLVAHLQNSDVFIIPRARNVATESAFPTKFAEYLAIGKPLIVTDVDETADLVRKYDCGFACEPNNDSIAETILEASMTPCERINEMGKNGRRLAENVFDERALGHAHYRFLSQVITT